MEGDAGSGRLNPTRPPQRPTMRRTALRTRTIDDKVTTAVDETAPADAGAVAIEPARRPSRLDGGRWLAGICAVLLLAGVAVAAGGYLAHRSHAHSVAAARAESAALAAAKDCVAATQAPTPARWRPASRRSSNAPPVTSARRLCCTAACWWTPTRRPTCR